MRRAAKRDKNESEIVDALRAVGCSVDFLNGKGTPDLLCGVRGKTFLLEVKGYAGQLTDDQIDWRRKWRGEPPTLVRSVEDALRVVKSLRLGFQV